MKQEKFESFFSLIRLGKEALNHSHDSHNHTVTKEKTRSYVEVAKSTVTQQKVYAQ